MSDERLSASKAAPEVTVAMAERTVTYQAVVALSLPEFECVAGAPELAAAAVMATNAAAVLAAVLAALVPRLLQAQYGARQPSLLFTPMWQATKLPKVCSLAARALPATKLVRRSSLFQNTAAPMTGRINQV